MKRLLTILCCFLSLMPVLAQNGMLLTTDRGLRSSLVYDITQDHAGYVWIATRNGLMRYDGYNFVAFQNDGTKGCLASDYAYRVVSDHDARLFVGTDAGVQLFDYAAQSFTQVPMVRQGSDQTVYGVSSMTVLDNNDVLVASSGYGVYRIKDGQDKAVYDNTFDVVTDIHDMVQAPDGRIWCASEGKGVFCYDKGHKKIYVADKSLNLKFYAICVDKIGRVFASTLNGGLYVYDKDKDDFVHVQSSGRTCITSLLPLGDGTLLVGTDGYGTKRYWPDQGRLDNAGFYSQDIDLMHTKVSTMLEDRAGNVWLGLFQKGIFMQPGHLPSFGYIGYKSGLLNVIGSACVMSVFHDSKGYTWIGTDNDGLYILDKAGSLVRHFAPDVAAGGCPATVLSIAEDDKQQIWVGSYLQGAGTFDRNTGRFSQLPFTSKGGALHVFDMLFDRQGRLWIATLGDGLKCYDPATAKLTEYRMPTVETDSTSNKLSNNWVSDIALSNDGKRLYVCMSMGLTCLDLTRNSFVSTFGKNHILGGVAIQKAFEDRDGTLWVGSAKGLYKVSLKDGVQKLYTTKDGLTDNSVSSIEQDSRGRLWISTAYGMSVMDIKKESFTNYYASNGLQGNEFSERASIRVNDTLMIFGGNQGLSFFDPLRVGSRHGKLMVYVTGLKVNGEPVVKGDKSGRFLIMDTTVAMAKRFDLAHDDNSVTVSLSTMEFGNEGGVRYAYSIGGDDWICLPEGANEVALSHLPPGKYDFRVKALQNDSESDVWQFDIVIHPAWYATWWAYLIYALIIVALACWYLHNLHREEQFKLRLQEHIHAEQLDEAKAQLVRAQAQMIESISQESAPNVDSPDQKLLKRIIAVINKHVSDPDYNIEMIAEEVGLSRVHLYRKMKELTNQSPSEFIGNIRLKQAAQMLSEQKHNIEEIAYSCGFNSPASFSRKFKNFYGKSPTEYMKEQNM